jgi:carbonic anhydrase
MNIKKIFIPIIVIALMASCGENKKTTANSNGVQNNKVLTAEDRSKLTSDKVLEILQKGNKEFVNNQLTVRNNTERVKDAVNGQYPEAVILSCIDSRVPVEDIFHCAIGDIFVARVAGNIVNLDILGSIEYACKVSGSKLVVVMGHDYCGAVKSAISDVELGNITELLSKIKPAVERSKASFVGEANASNHDFVELVCHTNVELMMDEIRKNSPILKEMEINNEIKIVGAMYDLHSGKVDFFE